MSKKS